MTYQAYLDNIQAQTGKTPEDFKALAAKKGYLEPGVKAGEIVTWLKDDFGLGRGHAMAIVLLLRQANSPRVSTEEGIDRHFTGERAHWRKPYDKLVGNIKKFGPDVRLAPSQSYISLLRGSRKFGILQITANRMDIGIKCKGVQPAGRFKAAGAWNQMVTHRVQVHEPGEIDREILSWLRQAYDGA